MRPYNDKLASLHSQFRQLDNDYNLALKDLKIRYSESHAIQLLHRMEKSLMLMGEVMDRARRLTEEVRKMQIQNDKHKERGIDGKRAKRNIVKERLYKHIRKRIWELHPGFNIGVTTPITIVPTPTNHHVLVVKSWVTFLCWGLLS